MAVTGIERVDLRRVDAGRLGDTRVLDHLRGRPRLDAHRSKRDLAAQLLGRDLEDPAPLVEREDEALAAPAAADVHADAGRGHALQVCAEAGLVEPTVDVERRDADGEDARRARPPVTGSHDAR